MTSVNGPAASHERRVKRLEQLGRVDEQVSTARPRLRDESARG